MFCPDDPPAAPDPAASISCYHGAEDLLDLLAPYAVRVTPHGLIANLANINRYVGSIRWSVAAHTLLADGVGRALHYAPAVRTAVLAHDFHEGIMGDIAAPTIKAIARIVGDGRNPVKILQAGLQHAVEHHLGLPHPDQATLEQVRFADQAAYLLEVVEFWPQTAGPATNDLARRLASAWWTPMHLDADGRPMPGAHENLRNLSTEMAARLLRRRFAELHPEPQPEPTTVATARQAYHSRLWARETEAVESLARTMTDFLDNRMAAASPAPDCA